MKKLVYDWNNIESQVSDICRRISVSRFKPDYVVGLTRGGNIPATMISHWFNCRCEALKVSLRDDSGLGPESNLWMAEDAFGYVPQEEQAVYKSRWDIARRKNILIVDDINDSGATFAWIKQDWQSGCLPNEVDAWNSVWAHNVKFVSLVENTASEFTSDYSAVEINKAEEDCWIVFPWENWWYK
jgi:hypoxanthine phosphoribosyltransferase